MKSPAMRPYFFPLFPLLIGGCQSINNFADNVGSHLPVVGDRCEHWQCFTDDGQAQSNAKKRQRMMEGQKEQMGANGSGSTAAAPQPQGIQSSAPVSSARAAPAGNVAAQSNYQNYQQPAPVSGNWYGEPASESDDPYSR